MSESTENALKGYTRYISLYGFFAFHHPEHWVNELDSAGNFIFFDPNGGSGVVRVITEQRVVTNDQDAALYLDKIKEAQKDYDASELFLGEHRFIKFVQIHEMNGTAFQITFFVTAEKDKVIMFNYTVQQTMSEMPVAVKEMSQLETLLSTVEFMHGEDHDHHH